MRHFCTYCDRGYAARLLCLHDSLRAQGEPFRLYVQCFDPETEAVVGTLGRPDLVSVPLSEVLAADSGYAAVRNDRTPVEFCFTTTPVLVRHCLRREPEAGEMTYLDADLFFFGPASAVWREQGDGAVGIVPHRFPPRLAARLVYGTFNVSWVSFRREPASLECLEWWRERCLEWCHDVPDHGRFADQGYLDEFPRRFERVSVLDHPGINAAPWNIGETRLSRGRDGIMVDGKPLLFYHFQGIRELVPGWFEPGLRAYGTNLARELRDWVYAPYLAKLAEWQRYLQREHGIALRFLHQRLNADDSWRDRWERLKARWLLPCVGRWRGQLLHSPGPRSR